MNKTPIKRLRNMKTPTKINEVKKYALYGELFLIGPKPVSLISSKLCKISGQFSKVETVKRVINAEMKLSKLPMYWVHVPPALKQVSYVIY